MTMTGHKGIRLSVVWTLLWLLPLTAAGKEIGTLPGWSELTLELPPAIVVKAAITTEQAETVVSKLHQSPKALLPPPGKPVFRLTIETKLKWFLSSKTWLGQLWLTPELQALQRTRLKFGKQGSFKIYRYAEHGVYRIRREPEPNSQQFQSPESWPEHEGFFYPFPDSARQYCGIITDPYSILILIARAFPPAGPGPDSVCMFNKKGLYRVRFIRSGTVPIRVDYLQKTDRKTRVRNTVNAEKIVIQPLPYDPEKESEPFEFLEMEGDITLLRDPQSHLPLQMEGNVPGFGRATLHLSRVKLTR